MTVIRATGAIADALRRYDPELDIRYSWERRQWAIVYRTRRPDLLPPPVKNVLTEAGTIEILMPEKSEIYISYRTKTYPAAYVPKLSWNVFHKIIASDTMLRGSVKSQMQQLKQAKAVEARRVAKDRWKEARTYMNWHARTHPLLD